MKSSPKTGVETVLIGLKMMISNKISTEIDCIVLSSFLQYETKKICVKNKLDADNLEK